MIIVLSDLHFSDARLNTLGSMQFNHNLPAIVYKSFFREIAEFIREENIKRIDLVLAGDIFELTRSMLWYQDALRPYVHNSLICANSPMEARVLEVLEGIAGDSRVDETLNIFRNLAVLFQKQVNIHFLPGNHDRLLNASGAIRRKVRSLLGLSPLEAYFQNQYVHYHEGQTSVLIRHGHEYDPQNFGFDYRLWSRIPTFIDREYYDRPSFGDFVTLEVAARLPQLFREYYSDHVIGENPELMAVFQRLMDFDNVRPSSALFNFLLSTPGVHKKDVWRWIDPILRKLLDSLVFNNEIKTSLACLSGNDMLSSPAIKALMTTRPWRMGIPFWTAQSLMGSLSKKTQLDDQSKVILREECAQAEPSQVHCVVSGHTHNPLVKLLKCTNGKELYYLNSGSFRNMITPGVDQKSFGRMRSKARILIFEEGEKNPEYFRDTGWSFDFNARYAFGSIPPGSVEGN